MLEEHMAIPTKYTIWVWHQEGHITWGVGGGWGGVWGVCKAMHIYITHTRVLGDIWLNTITHLYQCVSHTVIGHTHTPTGPNSLHKWGKATVVGWGWVGWWAGHSLHTRNRWGGGWGTVWWAVVGSVGWGMPTIRGWPWELGRSHKPHIVMLIHMVALLTTSCTIVGPTMAWGTGQGVVGKSSGVGAMAGPSNARLEGTTSME